MKLENLVDIHQKKLNETDLYIWEYINFHRAECCNTTIEELAKNCNVSRSTVMRFAQKLSLNGFGELKVYLKWENQEREQIRKDVISDICKDYHRLIEDMEQKNLTDICRVISESKRIFLYGTGSVQSSVAKEMQRVFLSAQVCMIRIEGTGVETALVADMAQTEDLVIIISLSGESENSLKFARKLHRRRVPDLSITRNNNNELSRMSDYSLYISTSLVTSSYALDYETTTPFFLLSELLMVKYLFYIQNRE